jgi:DNA polymerase-1
MVEVAQALKDVGLSSRMILQVHDELVFEVSDAEAERLESLVRDRMGSVYALEVPLVVDVGLGSNWREAH